jgi:hypothetical protein
MVHLPSGLVVQPVEQKLWKMLPAASIQTQAASESQNKGGVRPMPQLVKGGKWVFGWVIVGPGRELPIPPEAWEEYRFQVGDEIAFLPGSQRSGGFGISHSRLLAAVVEPLQARALARARVDEIGWVTVPGAVGVQPGDRLLAVRGSGRALGFVAHGPLYEEALKHPELACFSQGART